jgi:hypothetical protein
LPARSTRFCGYCGAPLEPDSEFCGKCGKPVKVPVSVASSRIRGKLKALVALVIILVAAGTGAFYYVNTNKSPSQPVEFLGNSTSSGVATQSAAATASSVQANANYTSASSSVLLPPPQVSNISLLPSAVGCYGFGQSQWVTIPCASDQQIAKQGRFPQDTSLGISSNPTPVPGPVPTSCPSCTPLTQAFIMVNLHCCAEYESDSQSGSGAYSVQLNTNDFIGRACGFAGCTTTDWVQFGFQNFNGAEFCPGGACIASENTLCVWNINNGLTATVPGNKGPPGYGLGQPDQGTTCLTPSNVPLTDDFEVWIYAYLANGNINMVAYLNGHAPPHVTSSPTPGGVWGIVSPDVYGLTGAWIQAGGSILGAGGGSQASFFPNQWPVQEQTDIAVSSCPLTPASGFVPYTLFEGFSCSSANPWSGTLYQDTATAESNDLTQFNPVLTSYFSGHNWWLSSVSPSTGCTLISPSTAATDHLCHQFVNYNDALGQDNEADWYMTVAPSTLSVLAGQGGGADVNVTSVNGVDAGPITMSLAGMPPNLGTASLTPPNSFTPCYDDVHDTIDFYSFTPTYTPLQPGSTCSFYLSVTASQSALAGATTNVVVTSTPPGACVGCVAQQSTVQVTIAAPPPPAAPPTPVIVSPSNGGTINIGQTPPLIGYASNSAGLGWWPCDQLYFQVTQSDHSTLGGQNSQGITYQDPTYQENGECDVSDLSFTVAGPAVITLTAFNSVGATASTTVTVNVVSPQPQTQFTFQVTASPASSIMTVGGSPDQITVIVTLTGGTAQPVSLTVTGFPSNEISYRLSPCTITPLNLCLDNSPYTVTPTAAVTLTINAPTQASAAGTYTVTITGTGGGYTSTYHVQVTVESIG